MQFTFHPVPFWIITGYYLIINIVLFCAMALDKKRAIRGRRRVPEKTLFLMAILGGSIGGFVGMFTQHHKTYFFLCSVRSDSPHAHFPVLAADDHLCLYSMKTRKCKNTVLL